VVPESVSLGDATIEPNRARAKARRFRPIRQLPGHPRRTIPDPAKLKCEACENGGSRAEGSRTLDLLNAMQRWHGLIVRDGTRMARMQRSGGCGCRRRVEDVAEEPRGAPRTREQKSLLPCGDLSLAAVGAERCASTTNASSRTTPMRPARLTAGRRVNRPSPLAGSVMLIARRHPPRGRNPDGRNEFLANTAPRAVQRSGSMLSASGNVS
jgi:hypothetical protein